MDGMKKRLSGFVGALRDYLDEDEQNNGGESDQQKRRSMNRRSDDQGTSRRNTLKYTTWCNSVDKKVKILLDSLSSLSKITPAKNKSAIKKTVTTTLQEIVNLLELDMFTYEDYGMNTKHFKSVRDSLLDLWGHLLEMLERVEDNDASNFYKTILCVLKRREFDCSHLSFDVHNNPKCKEEDIYIAQRYRILLYTTQIFITTKLAKSIGTAGKSHHLYLFCTKALAINYFRITELDQQITKAVSLDPTQFDELVKDLVDLGATELHLYPNSLISAIKSQPMKGLDESKLTKQQIGDPQIAAKFFSSYPSLFQWNLFHLALIERTPNDNLDEKLSRVSKEWVGVLAKRDTLFFVFLREWIIYIKSVIGETFSGSWTAVPGYVAMVNAFLFEMKKAEFLNKPIVDTSISLIQTDTNIINTYMRILFSKTNVYTVPAVTECLILIEGWLKEIKSMEITLPPTFDHSNFCKAMDIILQTDHHQMIQRLLTLIYNYADLFEGESRKAIFSDLLIKQYFFDLFLHWDDNIRNSFQQIIVFRAIRLKRTVLHAEGLINVEELATRELGKTVANDDQPRTTNIEEKENFIDAIMFSKIESYVKLVQEQLRNPKAQIYNKELEVYVPKALSEYKMYMSRYYQWERSGQTEPPKLVPMHILNTMNID